MTGQPRPADDIRQPTAAERVRTLTESTASAVLTIAGACSDRQMEGPGHTPAETRAVAPDGTVILLVTTDSPAAEAVREAAAQGLAEVTAVLEITDVAPVAVPHRVRGRGWVVGWLTPVPAAERPECARLLDGRVPLPGELLLRLEAGEAHCDDLWGSGPVEPEEFAEAAADPLSGHEAELLQHLATAHQDRLRSLCGLVEDRPGGGAGWERVAPLALDRFGLRLRFWRADGGGFDARFDFRTPVREVGELRHAMHQLFASAAP